ncbi:hypothetical protein [Nonomuraea sp. NPDC049646]|uniref:hypothetical protein n=1 Tax=unclassified Nonomuraea TaxID=2593643 RepID=UPI0037936134
MNQPCDAAAPTVCAMVHYVSHGTPARPDGSQAFPSVCRAAIVTAVDTRQDSPGGGLHTGHVGLCVLNPDGLYFARAVVQDEVERRGGTWHWPDHDGATPRHRESDGVPAWWRRLSLALGVAGRGRACAGDLALAAAGRIVTGWVMRMAIEGEGLVRACRSLGVGGQS